MREKSKKTMGIELPFGFCIIRGSQLRELQKRCLAAELNAELRSRMITRMMIKWGFKN